MSRRPTAYSTVCRVDGKLGLTDTVVQWEATLWLCEDPMSQANQIVQHLAAKLTVLEGEIHRLDHECDLIEQQTKESLVSLLRDAGLLTQYEELIGSATLEVRQRESMIRQISQEVERIRSTLQTIERHLPEYTGP